MESKLRLILITSAFFVFFSLFNPTKALAAPHCDFPTSGGQIGISFKCGGFASPAELHSYTVNFHCAGRKSALGANMPCRLGIDVMDQPFRLAGVDYAEDPDGTFWTNIVAQGVDPNLFWYDIQLIDAAGHVVQSQSVEAAPQPILECTSGANKGINTALGCIPTDFTGGGFITALLQLAIGVASGIALLLILYGIFIVTTSTGIPDKLNAGRDIISSAIAGLIFIILSIFLLNLVGVKILAIPGL